MTPPLVDRIPFPKIVIVLASSFGISLGLCGLGAFAGGALRGSASSSGVMVVLLIGGAALMLLSAIGLVLTVFFWIVLSLAARGSAGRNDPQKLFDASGNPPKTPEDKP
ncbi:MAG TPA: hypothetical protein VK716_15405 [Terracidiphilus sp.]|jgi:hypothetical protein|nr:hypothetical protein [Terracidiphilus sp.]